MSTKRSMTASWTAFVELTQELRARQPARRGDHPRPDGAHAASPSWCASRRARRSRKGAKAHIDRAAFKADSRATAYLAPQVLTGVDHSMSVMQEESFGPVVGIMKVSSDEEAIRLMNDIPYGLTAAIWTAGRRRRRADRRRASRPARCFMNRCDYLDPGLTWTGRQGHRAWHGPLQIGF